MGLYEIKIINTTKLVIFKEEINYSIRHHQARVRNTNINTNRNAETTGEGRCRLFVDLYTLHIMGSRKHQLFLLKRGGG